MELTAYKSYNAKRQEICYWRTKSGLEVDFIIGNAVIAIEVKISHSVQKQDLKGIIAFCNEHQPQKAIVVSQDEHARVLQINAQCELQILPWREFLTALWQHSVW